MKQEVSNSPQMRFAGEISEAPLWVWRFGSFVRYGGYGGRGAVRWIHCGSRCRLES
ncbi:hypothetical protein PIB30_024266, partial [Stylosanthes scabra]|nr:hypothetical protein [Stylosanthes scabra]